MTTQDYIDANKRTAIHEAVSTGVPASITLAQGILESQSGNSRLATEANNHFGIKCHSDWYGEHIYADDDLPHECFRKYSSAKDSYKDHIKFLKENSRYAPLWQYGVGDWQSWAKGLQAAGYATSPTYADSLGSIITRYDLEAIDDQVKQKLKWRPFKIALVIVLLTLALILALRQLRKLKNLKYGTKNNRAIA